MGAAALIQLRMCWPLAPLQGMAGREGSTASGGVCGSFEVALQWLNVLYARECQPAALQPAADGEAAAGEAAHGAEGTAAEQQQKQQGAASGRRLASQSGAAASQYEATLLALLEALSEAGPPPHHPASKAVIRCAAGSRYGMFVKRQLCVGCRCGFSFSQHAHNEHAPCACCPAACPRSCGQPPCPCSSARCPPPVLQAAA